MIIVGESGGAKPREMLMMGRKMGILRDALKFVFGGEPVAKARPRFNSRTGAVYTHDKTKTYEEFLKLSAHAQMRGKKPLEGAICAEIMAFFKPAKRETRDYPTKKPDIDNIIKSVLDGLNGIAYADDKQVVSVSAEKHFSMTPRVTVALWRMK